MGSMFGSSVLGALLLFVVFLIGHVFNIMISSFGSYVHTARLHYVEFFGEFYESGGRPFEPFRLVPKYCHVVE
jgi:V/A-type H+-transporting ATPase subunit I